jgi:hypothetical protein
MNGNVFEFLLPYQKGTKVDLKVKIQLLNFSSVNKIFSFVLAKIGLWEDRKMLNLLKAVHFIFNSKLFIMILLLKSLNL